MSDDKEVKKKKLEVNEESVGELSDSDADNVAGGARVGEFTGASVGCPETSGHSYCHCKQQV